MKKITKTIDLYEFNELKKGIQDELIENTKKDRLNIYCDNFLLEDMRYKASELLKKYFNNNATFKNVYYSLSYCQGDGSMIEFDLSYYGEHLKIRQCGHYYHEKSFTILNDENISYKRIEKLKNKIIKMNQELVQYGYELIENTISDDEAIEILKEYYYTINGEYYCCIDEL